MIRIGRTICFFVFISLMGVKGFSQACTTLGQKPFTAFPVCGQSVFAQKNVPICSNNILPTPCTDLSYTDKNPFWYKFTCFSTGSLGFLITPDNSDDDYDWQLFDITGHDPSEVYTNKTLFVACSWGHPSGPTGAAAGGANSSFACSGTNPIIMRMPTITVGHNYLLMVSHFDDTQVGYNLSFTGGTAVITDPTIPTVQNAYAVCDGTEIVIKLNKKMKCNSIAADGSDFIVSGGPVNISIVSASGNGCSSGFDMDSVTLKLNRVLSPGTYTVTSKTGSDGNTLIDNCDNILASGQQATLRFTPAQPTPMDSITPVICIKDTIQLVFSKPMKCSSIAPDGSDFTITGPTAVNIKSARGICTNGVSTIVQIILASPIYTNGTFQVLLKKGSDGNTLIDECDEVTPAGSTISFTTKDIATASFINTLTTGCKTDTLFVSHDGNNNTNQWQWMVDSVPLSTAQKAVYISNSFTAHSVQLSISNGKCSDTASMRFTLPDQTVKSLFSVSSDTACSTDTLRFTDLSSGNAIAWKWDFGNGQIITQQDPGIQTLAATNNRSGQQFVKLVVRNGFNCEDTFYHAVYILLNCNIAVPTAFTPNGDGLNDKLYPLNSYKASDMVFRVYNRSGQILFEARTASKKWDGRVDGMLQPSGTYVWTLDYTDITKRQKVSLKGTTVLIR